MKKLLYIFFVLILVGKSTFADENKFPKEQFQRLYQLNIDTSQLKDATNAYYVLAENYNDFLFLLINGNSELFQLFKKRHAQRLENIEVSGSREKIKNFCAAEIDLQWALIHWRFGEYLRCGVLLRRAYKSLIDLQSKHPDFIEVNKSLGLLHIILSAIPEEFHWLTNLFGFENNFDRGFKELSKCVDRENDFQLEASLFLSYVYIFILDQKEEGFKVLEHIAPFDTKLASLSFIIFCHKAGENEKGLQEIYKNKWIFPPKHLEPIVSLLRGELHLKKLEYEDAIFNYKNFLLTYSGKGFVSNARLKLLYAYYLLGDLSKTDLEMNRKIVDESDLIVSDKYAQKFFGDKKLPNKVLLKSRLLFDGGYFEEARNQIQLYALSSKKDLEHEIEYYYRLARIEQSLKNFELCIPAFKKCIEIQGDASFYFAPNSCLQLGHIYSSKGEKEKAVFYYNQALEYRKYPYSQSIEHQSKSALNAFDSIE
ncbi:MAG: tetratricopeptide repeat protein [Cytophagales bacterium]